MHCVEDGQDTLNMSHIGVGELRTRHLIIEVGFFVEDGFTARVQMAEVYFRLMSTDHYSMLREVVPVDLAKELASRSSLKNSYSPYTKGIKDRHEPVNELHSSMGNGNVFIWTLDPLPNLCSILVRQVGKVGTRDVIAGKTTAKRDSTPIDLGNFC